MQAKNIIASALSRIAHGHEDSSFIYESDAVAILSALAEAGMVVVDKKPTAHMIDEGAKHTEGSELRAMFVWDNMIRAAQEKTNG